MSTVAPSIAVLGASGLIGEAVSAWLLENGFSVFAVARHFTPSQKTRFGSSALKRRFVDEPEEIKKIISSDQIDVVVNCVGVLQDGPKGSTDRTHREFVERLLSALSSRATPALLIHLSVPGDATGDATQFSRSKRAAEREIAERCKYYVVLRPGFVVAPAAYGGSALIRALAVQRFALPGRELDRPLAITDCLDVARTIAAATNLWRSGERTFCETWDVMSPQLTTVGSVIDTFRRNLGAPQPLVRMPSWFLAAGACMGDIAGWLGWAPPIRSTALREMQRGVTGDPRAWLEATKLTPSSLETIVSRLPPTIQEKWFAHLYLLKALIVSTLAIFWIATGVTATQPSSVQTALTILVQHGFSERTAGIALIVGCIVDVAIGTAIAFRKTCRAGLIAGLGLSLLYVIAGSALAPELWNDPLGPLLKILPEILLLAVALAVLDSR